MRNPRASLCNARHSLSRTPLALAALLAACSAAADSPPKPPPAAAPKRAAWWAFLPPRKPPVPAIQNPKSKIQNPIDAFLLAKLRAKGLDFAPPADRATLLRRLAFGLTGLPPSPERLGEPYGKAVERLLASPQYGERWGRHWLDVVRFGETDGGEHNFERPNAWPYRDYVIRAFNADKPYNQFVREQIAGDALFPGDREKTAATGFLVSGPWDQVSAELNQDPAMRKAARADELDDMVTTSCATFLALTAGCARCHDHKFDPIPAKDYYRLTAVFGGAGFGERDVATKEERARYDERTRAPRAELEGTKRELSALEGPASAPLLRTKYRALDEARRNERQRLPLNPLYNRNAFAPVTARYFRLAVTGHEGGRARIDRLELRPAARVVTDWQANEKAAPEKPAILALDLDGPRLVSEIVWSTDHKTGSGDGAVRLYRLEASDDGTNWRTIAASTDHVSRLELDLPTLTEEEISAALPPIARARRAALKEKEARLQAQLQAVPAPPRLYAVNRREMEKAFVLERGSVQKPGEEVTPGGLSALASLPAAFALPPDADDARRRLAFADWLTSPQNPLTARVIVNRVWYHYFGSGIVNTPSDFGLLGDRPSHPELLDWLAVSFVEHGWSLKWLHRQIVSSRAYQQSSRFDPKAHRVDAANRLLWRMGLRRMDAETLRDSVLAVTGSLDPRAGGPGFALHRKGDRGSYIYKALDNDGPEVWRRAVYRFVVRGGDRVLLDSFDCPDPSVATPQRTVSNTPVQALALMNNAFVVRQAGLFARRLEREAPTPDARVRRAYRLAFAREATPAETALGLRFLKTQPLALYCRALLNSNEFVYVP